MAVYLFLASMGCLGVFKMWASCAALQISDAECLDNNIPVETDTGKDLEAAIDGPGSCSPNDNVATAVEQVAVGQVAVDKMEVEKMLGGSVDKGNFCSAEDLRKFEEEGQKR